MARGVAFGDSWLYLRTALTSYDILLKRARSTLDHGEALFATLLSLVGAFGTIYFLSQGELFLKALTIDFWLTGSPAVRFSFGVTLLGFMYLVYVHTREKKRTVPPQALPSETHQVSDWHEIHRMPRKKKISVIASCQDETIRVLEHAFDVAYTLRSSSILPEHLFLALLKSADIQNVFLRLALPPGLLEAAVKKNIIKTAPQKEEPTLSPEAESILFHAYHEAANSHAQTVRPTHVLLTTIRMSAHVQEALYDVGIDAETVEHVVAWVKLRENLREAYVTSRHAAMHVSKHGLDRAMTAVATPYLASVSTDITLLAKYGRLHPTVQRDREIAEVFRLLESGKGGVVLVGDHGTGKMSIIHGLAERIMTDDCPKELKEKRLLLLSTTALLSGATLPEAEARLARVAREASRAKNVVLCINNIHDLSAPSGDGEGLDISEAISEWVSNGALRVVATATPDGFNRHLVRTRIGSAMGVVHIKEPEPLQAIEMLEAHVGSIEYRTKTFISYSAVKAAVSSAIKFLHDEPLPLSALTILEEAATLAKHTRGEHVFVSGEDVASVVAEKTGVPAATVSSHEAELLLHLEEELHQTVIGQEEAVTAISEALRRARTALTSGKRPLATFLFLGPTGVGKTELVKTIARVYFGGEERMIRLDMSEFQDTSAVYRLIGEPGKPGTGLLTEAVRQHPFSLVLLDELEKADKGVMNLFLQVFDDGRLTDSVGRVIDFRNTMIVATSNAGTAFAQAGFAKGDTASVIRTALVHGELATVYRPEFLNRFDGIILFRPLTKDDVRRIAKLMLRDVEASLDERGVTLKIEDAALDTLAALGYDPEFGARPMRRAIQDTIENAIAEKVLKNELSRRDTLVVGENLHVQIEKAL